MEDTISLTVKLRGGEALFITPVSYDWGGEDNKFHLYPTLEFLPNIPYVLKGNYIIPNNFHVFNLWKYRATKISEAVKVFINIFLDEFKDFIGSNVFDSWFQNRTWDWGYYCVSKELSHDWFYAVDIFQPYEPLHLVGNIEVDWSRASKYITWDIGYLSPSSLWVEERLKKEFHVWTFDKEEDKVAEEKFWKWRQEQIDKGYEVFYITSLET